ncbi:helix-turn-helix domain-containing protein [Nevskia sp.]|uniref:winged helix-turn-helix transcriptional regulator n=1 Tax=Nevskia sp. TaxID=1929292 RepID=UPI0025E5F74D|nr:helix-turn-helix domain-containing protein [Nevskia sp.]HET7797266.1 helix-turn-helix domain-containing protein [Nevskia sp.]
MAITRKKLSGCPIEVTINAVAARWKAMILWQLRPGARSFTALRRAIPGISDRMLQTQLKQLADDGVVRRSADDVHPEWQLTPLGEHLLPVMDAMKAWGEASQALTAGRAVAPPRATR